MVEVEGLLARELERTLVRVGKGELLHGAVYVRTAKTHLGTRYCIDTLQSCNQRAGDAVRLGYLSKNRLPCSHSVGAWDDIGKLYLRFPLSRGYWSVHTCLALHS